MANQKPYFREGQTIQWPIRSRKSEDRLYNGQSEKDKLYNGQSEAVIQRRTDYTMTKRKRTTCQTIIYKILYRKIKQ